jgi:hypothetical protein
MILKIFLYFCFICYSNIYSVYSSIVWQSDNLPVKIETVRDFDPELNQLANNFIIGNLTEFWAEFNEKPLDKDKVAEDEKRVGTAFSTTSEWSDARDFSFYGLLIILSFIIGILAITRYRNRGSLKKETYA